MNEFTFPGKSSTHSIRFINSFKMPSMVYIGGAHVKPTKPLPADLQVYLDEANHGAIYFSLGSAVNASKLPADSLDMFLGKNLIWKSMVFPQQISFFFRHFSSAETTSDLET